jgi:hypothetical protein
LTIVSPASSATIRGRCAPTHITPVTTRRTAAATSEEWSRPCTAISIRLPTANAAHSHHTTTAVGDRNTCLDTPPL